jgi:hypothetical protein
MVMLPSAWAVGERGIRPGIGLRGRKRSGPGTCHTAELAADSEARTGTKDSLIMLRG